MGDDEVERLRRRAFSRDGTPDDLRRLGELEAEREAAARARDAEPPVEAGPESEPVGEHPESGTEPAARRHPGPEREAPPASGPGGAPARGRVALVLAGTAGLAAGVVLTASILGVPGRAPEGAAGVDPGAGSSPVAAEGGIPALEIFDRPATAADDRATLTAASENLVPGSFDDVELRSLGVVEGIAAYAVRGTRFRQTHVCLLAQTADVASVACAALEDFADRGLRLRIGHLDILWNADGMRRWIGVQMPGWPT